MTDLPREPQPPPLPQPGDATTWRTASPAHYLALCNGCLGLVFVAQFLQGMLLGNLLSVLVGVLGLVSRLRIGPMLFVSFVGAVQVFHQTSLNRSMPLAVAPGFRLQLHELLLCAGVIGYVLGHYRLQTFWHGIWPSDPRQHAGPPRRRLPFFKRRHPVLRETRPQELVTPLEVAWLVMSLPLWALAGMLLWAILRQRWSLVGMPGSLIRILFVLLFLSLVFYCARLALGYWRHRRRDHNAARLFLQDVLWNETRGEQRRLNRWLTKAKRRLKSSQEQ